MIILNALFTVVSIVLLPIAWIVGCLDKFLSSDKKKSKSSAFLDKYTFYAFGMVILVLDVISDLYWFWKNNFRTDLK